jgi:thymidine phosphorylase
MVSVGNAAGVATRALLTRMDQPIGRAVGNSLELVESIECLQGRGPADTMELTLALGEQMLVLAGRCASAADARAELLQVVQNGAAWEKFLGMVRAQDGMAGHVLHPEHLPQAAVVEVFRAKRGGVVTAVGARRIAEVAHDLGAGRNRAGEPINPAVGISHIAKIGERIEAGAELCRVHAATPGEAAIANQQLETSFEFGADSAPSDPVVAEVIS